MDAQRRASGRGDRGRRPEPPALSGPGDHLTALATWDGVLHQDIRKILDQVGPEPLLRIAPVG